MTKKLINIALDLETLSLREDAAIIQIGACIPKFDRIHLPVSVNHEFEATIKYEEALHSEFHKDNETMEWWEKQDAHTRAYVFSGQESYDEAFEHFVYWISSIKADGADVAIWGNGSDFDNRLLHYSLSSFGYNDTWNFRNNRDLRTLKQLFPVEVPLGLQSIYTENSETKHTALGDARYEARLIDQITNTYLYAQDALC